MLKFRNARRWYIGTIQSKSTPTNCRERVTLHVLLVNIIPTELQVLKHDHPILVKALKLGTRCFNQVVKNENEATERPAKSKFRQSVGSRKVVAPTVREYCMNGLLMSGDF